MSVLTAIKIPDRHPAAGESIYYRKKNFCATKIAIIL